MNKQKTMSQTMVDILINYGIIIVLGILVIVTGIFRPKFSLSETYRVLL